MIETKEHALVAMASQTKTNCNDAFPGISEEDGGQDRKGGQLRDVLSVVDNLRRDPAAGKASTFSVRSISPCVPGSCKPATTLKSV